MRLTILSVLALLAIPFSALANAGPVVPVTKAKQPEFIKVDATRLQDGSTKFKITLMPHDEFKPADAYVQLKDGERVRFTARLVMAKEAGKDEWYVEAWADDKFVRDGRILITYGLTTGEMVSENWSVALSDFAPKR